MKRLIVKNNELSSMTWQNFIPLWEWKSKAVDWGCNFCKHIFLRLKINTDNHAYPYTCTTMFYHGYEICTCYCLGLFCQHLLHWRSFLLYSQLSNLYLMWYEMQFQAGIIYETLIISWRHAVSYTHLTLPTICSV